MASSAEDLGLDVDVGNLLISDPRHIAATDGESIESIILTEATQLTRILLDRVWALPLERVEDVVVAELPKPSTILPRAKPIPRAQPMTKWERFAKEKGIHNQKKSRKMWDEQKKDWKPRWGYDRATNPEEDDWVVEVPLQSDGMEDPFEQKKHAKKERVAKNELQRLRNVARAHKTKIPAGGILTSSDSRPASKRQVTNAAMLSRTANASAGKFTENLPKEKPPVKTGKKRKFESDIGEAEKEKSRMMGILEGINKKKPRLDVQTALRRVTPRSEKSKRKPDGDNEERRKRPQYGGKQGKGISKDGVGKPGGKPGKTAPHNKQRKAVKTPHRR